MVSFRFASSVQSCCGKGGALQADVAVCWEHSPCSGHTGFAPHRGACAFPVYTAQAPGCSIWSGSCVECGSSFPVLHNSADSVAPACYVFPGLSSSGSQRLGRPLPGCGAPFAFVASGPGRQGLQRPLPGRGAPIPSTASRLRQPEAWRPLPGCGAPISSTASRLRQPEAWRPLPGRGAPFPSAAPARAAGRVSGSLQTGTGAVCPVGGGGFSGAEFAPCPSPCLLPPVGMDRLFSGVSQSLCFANRRQCVLAG